MMRRVVSDLYTLTWQEEDEFVVRLVGLKKTLQWYFRLDSRSGSKGSFDNAYGVQSLLTDRSFDEIQAELDENREHSFHARGKRKVDDKEQVKSGPTTA